MGHGEHISIARSVGEILATEVPTIARAMWVKCLLEADQ